MTAGQRKLVERSLGHEAALLHDQDLVESIEEAQAMYRANDAGVGEGCEQVCQDPCLGRQIEARGRLLHEDDIAPLILGDDNDVQEL